MKPGSVLIVGAGVSGLSCALQLARMGWRCTVLEKSANLRNHGYLLGLTGVGHRAAERLGVLTALEKVAWPLNENRFFNSKNKELFRFHYTDFFSGLNSITLSRSDLVDVLYEHILAEVLPVEFLFSKTLTRIEEHEAGLTAHLSDNCAIDVDFLIGGDGVHSKTRDMIFGDSMGCYENLGYSMAGFTTAVEEEHLFHDIWSYTHAGSVVEVYSPKNTNSVALYIWKSEENNRNLTRRQQLESLKKVYVNSHPNSQKYLDRLAEDEPFFYDQITMIDLPKWSVGRSVLVGDSAFCPSLVSGQGAGMAMAAAIILSEKIDQLSIDSAFHEYEKIFRPIVQQQQARSRSIAPRFIPATPFSFMMRNLMMYWMPRGLLRWYSKRHVLKSISATNII